MEAAARGFADAIFTNENGYITEGAIHNIFVRNGSLWRTPPVSAGVLPGVYRRHLLATQANTVEANLNPDDLQSADEIWLTNAVRGIRNATL
jgi:para-aminobenzoate synthetase/4-amino-4-deoxychorismate lyase